MSIGDRAFGQCNGLTTITYKGTIAGWKNIVKGSAWKYDVPSGCIIKCVEGEVTIDESGT